MICDIDRDMWIQLAVSMFQGDARVFWQYCDQEILLGFSWAEFCQRLADQFQPRDPTPTPAPPERREADAPAYPGFDEVRDYIFQTERMVMLSGETVMSYAARFEEIVRRRCPLPNLTEANCCELFWRGLPMELRQRVIKLFPPTLQEFIVTIRTIKREILIEHLTQSR